MPRKIALWLSPKGLTDKEAGSRMIFDNKVLLSETRFCEMLENNIFDTEKNDRNFPIFLYDNMLIFCSGISQSKRNS